jgi:hypothetical protein
MATTNGTTAVTIIQTTVNKMLIFSAFVNLCCELQVEFNIEDGFVVLISNFTFIATQFCLHILSCDICCVDLKLVSIVIFICYPKLKVHNRQKSHYAENTRY